jgi:hypothetical protein
MPGKHASHSFVCPRAAFDLHHGCCGVSMSCTGGVTSGGRSQKIHLHLSISFHTTHCPYRVQPSAFRDPGMCLAHLGVSAPASSFYHPVPVSPHICLIEPFATRIDNTATTPSPPVTSWLTPRRTSAVPQVAGTRNAVAQHSKGHLVSLACTCSPPPSPCLYRLLWFEVSQPGQPDSHSLYCRQSVILCSTCSLLRVALCFFVNFKHRRSITTLVFLSTNSIP